MDSLSEFKTMMCPLFVFADKGVRSHTPVLRFRTFVPHLYRSHLPTMMTHKTIIAQLSGNYRHPELNSLKWRFWVVFYQRWWIWPFRIPLFLQPSQWWFQLPSVMSQPAGDPSSHPLWLLCTHTLLILSRSCLTDSSWIHIILLIQLI